MTPQNNKIDWMKVITVTFFLSVPFASSLISTWHIFDFFELGNPSWMSIVLSVVIELGALASLLALANMKKLKPFFIWFVFSLLFFLQIVGNVFYSYKYITESLATNSKWLSIFTEFIQTLGLVEDTNISAMKMILSCIIGLPIPLISISFLKSTVDYLKPDEIIEIIPVLNTETVTEELKPIEENIVEESNKEDDIAIPNEEIVSEEISTEVTKVQPPKSGIHVAVHPKI